MRCRSLLLLVMLAGTASALPPSGYVPPESPAVEVHFSPRGGCQEAIVRLITRARRSILLQAYSFTSAPIASALVAARTRGVDVRVVVDRSQRGPKSRSRTVRAGNVPVWIDSKHAIAHNKVIVIDGGIVSTGSYNFTQSAEVRNAENLIILRDTAIAAVYAENIKTHLAHSEPLR